MAPSKNTTDSYVQPVALDHVVLRVTDTKKSIHFYCEILGCSVERTLPDLGLVQLRAGNALVDLVDVESSLGRQGGPAPGRTAHNMDHVCLRIKEFDEKDLANYLSSHGITPGDVGRRYGADGFGPSMYIKDPDGNTVELKGPPDDAP